MFKQIALIAAIAGAVSLTGCVVAQPPNTVSAYDVQRMSTVVDATVLSVTPVTLQGRDTGVGTVSGAVIGGIAGSNVGGPRTGGIVGVAGAVVGGLIGNAVERDATQRQGVEILLQLKNGDRRSVVQANGPDVFAAGEPVIMVTTGSTAPSAYPTAYPAPAPQQ